MKVQLSILAAAATAILMAVPLSAADTSPKTKTATVEAARSAWPPETLSGKITMVDPAENTVVVRTSDGVPFDMVVTPHTRIQSGDRSLSFQDLENDTNRSVSVRFVPERRGDVARSIQLDANS